MNCACGHAWYRHVRTPNGAWACKHHGCGCRDVVMPDEADFLQDLKAIEAGMAKISDKNERIVFLMSEMRRVMEKHKRAVN